MSPSTPFATFSGKTIPGEQDARIGGVWSATSAKRDKLIELKGELVAGQLSLDDAATPEQTLDLFLADGMHVIAKASDLLESSNLALVDLQEWMDGQAKPKRAKGMPDCLLNYAAQGKRSYLIASRFDDDVYRDEAPVLKRLAAEFVQRGVLISEGLWPNDAFEDGEGINALLGGIEQSLDLGHRKRFR